MISCSSRQLCFLLLSSLAIFALAFHFWIEEYFELDLKGVLWHSPSNDSNHQLEASLIPPDTPPDQFSGSASQDLWQDQPSPFRASTDSQGRLVHTTILNNVSSYGFTIFDNLYLRNGTLYIVTDNSDSFPQISHIVSKPDRMGPGQKLSPTEKEMQIVNPDDAEALLGERAFHLDGFTVLLYDPKQFTRHYYHWWGEIILGIWRVYTKFSMRGDGSIPPFQPPTRLLTPFLNDSDWRDGPELNAPLTRAAFPTMAIENQNYWRDLMKLESTVVFSRVMVVNRVAAHTHPFTRLWNKMIAGTMNITLPEGFWEPLRHSVLGNLLGYIPTVDESVASKPVVTYITRRRRTLNDLDHRKLVVELENLEREGVCEVQVVKMENMTLKEQIELAASTTIMLGVHGNGLTHQLWMAPSAKSTIIEIFIPTGYNFDYEILARNVGHRHYAIWNDTALTYPKGTTHKAANFPKGFHDNEIPVHAPTVTRIIRERLTELEVASS